MYAAVPQHVLQYKVITSSAGGAHITIGASFTQVAYFPSRQSMARSIARGDKQLIECAFKGDEDPMRERSCASGRRYGISFAIASRCCFQLFASHASCAFEGDECAFKGDEDPMWERRGCTADSQEPFNAVLASAEDSDKPVAFRVLSQCRWAADELLLPLRACIVLDHEKIARSPWRYHDGVSPGRRPERQHPEEHCRWGRETHSHDDRM